MASYSYGQLEGLWTNAGGSPALAPIMAAIALAESGGRSDAINRDSNGTTDTGLWQINSVHNLKNLNDPAANAAAAVKIERTQGLKAWTTYSTGAYKKFLKGGVQPVTTGLPTGSTSTASATPASDSIGGAIGSGFASAFASIFAPFIDIMIWGVETLLGTTLIVVGILIMVANSKAGKSVEQKAIQGAKLFAVPEG